MYCHECGKQLLDDCVYCPECGKKVVRIEEGNLESQNVGSSLREINESTVNKNAYYKHIIICAIIILVSIALLPIYYFESSSYHVWVKFLGNSSAVRTYFGSARGIPMIRYNTMALAVLVFSSIFNITMGYKHQTKHTTKGFVVMLCTMILHLIIQAATLASKGTVAIGFFVIVIVSIIGATFSHRCNQEVILEGKDIES